MRAEVVPEPHVVHELLVLLLVGVQVVVAAGEVLAVREVFLELRDVLVAQLLDGRDVEVVERFDRNRDVDHGLRG